MFLSAARARLLSLLATATFAAPLSGCALFGVGSSIPPGPPATTRSLSADTATSLIQLGNKAVDRGDLRVAEERFRRVLAAQPDSTGAHLGMARVALARDDRAAARTSLERVFVSAPDDGDALLELAFLERAEGNTPAAIASAERAVRARFTRPRAHWLLYELTGRSVPGELGTDPTNEAVVERAARHPYDIAANVDAAVVLHGEGQQLRALQILNGILWFADLDPEAASRAIELLRELDPAWKERRVVRVHLLADENFRSDPWWTMRARLLMRFSLERSLAPVLDISFIPASIQPFAYPGASASLVEIHEAAKDQFQQPRRGMVLVLAERTTPVQRQSWKLGIADFLGEWATVRINEGEVASRVVVHEVLHLFGAVHLSPEIPSIMNPYGVSMALDEYNRRIASLVRNRRFSTDTSLREELFRQSDLAALAEAYTRLLQANITVRNEGLSEAREQWTSERLATEMARTALAHDPHNAQVAELVSELYLALGHPEGAAAFLDTASQLIGRKTEAGRAFRARRREILSRMAELEESAESGVNEEDPWDEVFPQ